MKNQDTDEGTSNLNPTYDHNSSTSEEISTSTTSLHEVCELEQVLCIYKDLRILLEECLLERLRVEKSIGMTTSRAREIKILIDDEPSQTDLMQENTRLEQLLLVLLSRRGQLTQELRDTEVDLIQTRRNLDEVLFEMSQVKLEEGQWVNFSSEEYTLVSCVPSTSSAEIIEGTSAKTDKGKGVMINSTSKDSSNICPKPFKEGTSGSSQLLQTPRYVQPRGYQSVSIPPSQWGYNIDNRRIPMFPWPDFEDEEIEVDSFRTFKTTKESSSAIIKSEISTELQTEPFISVCTSAELEISQPAKREEDLEEAEIESVFIHNGIHKDNNDQSKTNSV